MIDRFRAYDRETGSYRSLRVKQKGKKKRGRGGSRISTNGREENVKAPMSST
jgi:hypothetical protein